jgi:uncharacterized protein (DUF1015 family)
VPDLHPFRALRYDPSVGDPRDLVSPPYDVISPEQQRALLRRHPRNVVRLDLPSDEPGDPPDERYRRAARDLAAWRSDGTLRTDRQSSVYPYAEEYVVPGSAEQRVQRGFFARLRVDEPGPASGILPHERTLSAPKEDRYRLLRATRINASPVVLLFADDDGAAIHALELASRGDALTDLTDDDGVRHRLWRLPVDDAGQGQLASELLRAAALGPLTIADGHHRYETALRYREERRRDRSLGDPEPFDYLLALLVPIDQPLTVLATHRVVRDGLAGDALLSAAADLFEVERLPSREALLGAFAPDGSISTGRTPEPPVGQPGDDPSGGRPHLLGLWTGGTAALLRARPSAFGPLLDPSSSPTLRWLDVNLLSVALERMSGIDREAGAGGGRIAYTKDPEEALAVVDRGEGVAAFLLAPTTVDEVLRGAAAGETMPQKSPYFYPKQVTGLVLNPHEW